MNVHVPYTVILQDDVSGSVSSKVYKAPVNTPDAQRYVTMVCPKGMHVVALVRGEHPIIPGLPVST